MDQMTTESKVKKEEERDESAPEGLKAEVEELKKEAEEMKAEAQELHSEAEEIKAEAQVLHSDAEEIKDEIHELKGLTDIKELLEFKEKYFYAVAELENANKRFEREKQNIVKYSSEKILLSLVEVIDNLERTIEALGSEDDEKIVNMVKGVEMVRDQFLDVLKQSGLEPVAALGEIFDPNFHEAMAQQPAEGKKDQEIIQEYQRGYVLNGRLLRAAKVIVAKN